MPIYDARDTAHTYMNKIVQYMLNPKHTKLNGIPAMLEATDGAFPESDISTRPTSDAGCRRKHLWNPASHCWFKNKQIKRIIRRKWELHDHSARTVSIGAKRAVQEWDILHHGAIKGVSKSPVIILKFEAVCDKVLQAVPQFIRSTYCRSGMCLINTSLNDF